MPGELSPRVKQETRSGRYSSSGQEETTCVHTRKKKAIHLIIARRRSPPVEFSRQMKNREVADILGATFQKP